MSDAAFNPPLDDVALIAALRRSFEDMDDICIDMSQPLATFEDMGLDSIGMLIVANSLEERLAVELPNHLMWDCPDFPSLAQHLRTIVDDEKLARFVAA